MADDTHGGTCSTCGGAALCVKSEPDHILELTDEGWTLQHSLACRVEGAMSSCGELQAVQYWAAHQDGPPEARGRFLVSAPNGQRSLMVKPYDG